MSEWIKCNDRLPKRGEYKEILTFQMIENSKGKVVPHVSIDERDSLYVRKGRLYADFGVEEITHWMPLPMPPKD